MRILPVRTSYNFKGIVNQDFINRIDKDASELLDRQNFQDFGKLMDLYRKIQDSTKTININVQEKSENENANFQINFTYNSKAQKILQGKSAASTIIIEMGQNKKYPATINILSIISQEIEKIHNKRF